MSSDFERWRERLRVALSLRNIAVIVAIAGLFLASELDRARDQARVVAELKQTFGEWAWIHYFYCLATS